MKPDFFDVRLIEGSSMAIVLDNGKVEEISSNHGNGCSVRALSNGCWGYTRMEGTCDTEKAIKTASELAKDISAESNNEPFSLVPIEEPEKTNLPAVKIDPRDIPVEEKVDFLKELDSRARCEGVNSTSAIYSESTVDVHYTSSEGLDCEYSMTKVGFAITAVASREGLFQAGRESKFGVGGFELFKGDMPLEMAEHAGKTAVELLDASPAKGGRFPVILDPELAGVFAHEAVGHASEADLVLEGSSILEGKIGEKIGSDKITIIDDPTLHEFGYYPFDAEGVQSHKTTIVEEGVLKSYLHSRETASKLGGNPGNCRAQGSSSPVVRMSNTYIDNGDSNLDEMLAEIGNGVYLAGSRGGQVNTGEGVFQFNAEKGYIVENGEIGELLRDVSLSGKTLEILNNVSMVARDLKMNSGRCGKSGQLIPVSDGSPHLLVSNALVGGA
ncbi:TldD protein [Methanohalophilus levihalophilus]|uniref:TldD/PmbA family protein n=1 Tax=Methanohalophilus levihalophilus TaxID=1431282 RepID=UPI001AEB5642|nr:TldD/PmbA family protein [Methanohalophilus levihalophilus]MBP2029558.1 TldD protein [Methanohalophilus levihalophilus]